MLYSPSWANDPSIGVKMINARAETLAEKPSFRKFLAKRRCLVVADGFYEWQVVPGQKTKTPMRFALKSRESFAFAGLWDRWKNPKGGDLETFTIITIAANDTIRPVHDRMLVILPQDQGTPRLDPDLKDAWELLSMLKSNAVEEIAHYPVSTLVNSPRNDLPKCMTMVS